MVLLSPSPRVIQLYNEDNSIDAKVKNTWNITSNPTHRHDVRIRHRSNFKLEPEQKQMYILSQMCAKAIIFWYYKFYILGRSVKYVFLKFYIKISSCCK
jgi:hypothetical protein